MVECPTGNTGGLFMRFTIRDLLWITVVVAMGAGWYLEYRNRGPENLKLHGEIAKLEQSLASKEREFWYKLHDRDDQMREHVKALERAFHGAKKSGPWESPN